MSAARIVAVGVILGLFLGNTGCNKSDDKGGKDAKSADGKSASASSSATNKPLARIHWMGMKHIAAEPNATNIAAIWALPETQRLVAQTLDKIAGRSWVNGTNCFSVVTNDPTARLIRPLLDDLVQEESYWESRGTENLGGENTDSSSADKGLVLAIRLSAERAALWQTNLNAAFSEKTKSTNSIGDGAVARAGDWTVVAFGAGKSEWLKEIAERVSREKVSFSAEKPLATEPVTIAPSNAWLVAEGGIGALVKIVGLDLNWIASMGLNGKGDAVASAAAGVNTNSATTNIAETNLATSTTNHPSIPKSLDLPSANAYFWAAGEGPNVRTHADLLFDKPLDLKLDPWQLPTNLVRDPLIGFSAIRGIRPWLESTKFWQHHQLGNAPNQAFVWAQHGPPFLHFLAAPSPDASNQVWKLGDFILKDVNQVLSTNQPVFGTFERIPSSANVMWRGIPLFSPSLKYVQNSDGAGYILASYGASLLTNKPSPVELWRELETVTNLVYYDWEVTGACADGLVSMTQVARNVLGRARLTGSASLAWLQALYKKLTVSGTAIKVLDRSHLSFARTSTIGLTGTDLQMLADWLESPTFPIGVKTISAPPPPPRAPKSGTNSSWSSPAARAHTTILTNIPAPTPKNGTN
jgi:hypothetical protein